MNSRAGWGGLTIAEALGVPSITHFERPACASLNIKPVVSSSSSPVRAAQAMAQMMHLLNIGASGATNIQLHIWSHLQATFDLAFRCFGCLILTVSSPLGSSLIKAVKD